VDSSLHIWVRRIGVPLLVGAVLVTVLPNSARILGPAFGAAAWTAAAVGYVCIFVGIPFLLIIVGKSGYKVLLKPYVRAWRIRTIRDRRLLREAAARQTHAEE
jgi:hypothetical protein